MVAIERLSNYMTKRPQELRRMKAEGRKVIAYFPGDYVPCELIYASGASPLGLIMGGGAESA